MKINFFEYKENSEELKILLKSTSKFATREDLKIGQQLFKSIYEKIVAIEIKLGEIENAITNSNLEITGTREKELLNLGEFKIEYVNILEETLELETKQNMEYFYGIIQPRIEQIFEFLSSDFDYGKHKAKISKLEEDIKSGNNNLYSEIKLSEERFSIKKSIEIVLEYYSKISIKLMNYLSLFLNIKFE